MMRALSKEKVIEVKKTKWKKSVSLIWVQTRQDWLS